jgi:vacuolar protein sorting-associated protein 13A/C
LKFSVEPNHNVLYSWQNSLSERVLHWECGLHGYGNNNLIRDGLGDFYSSNDAKPRYWVSFLNGRQRILLFTEDLYEAVRWIPGSIG